MNPGKRVPTLHRTARPAPEAGRAAGGPPTYSSATFLWASLAHWLTSSSPMPQAVPTLPSEPTLPVSPPALDPASTLTELIRGWASALLHAEPCLGH